MSSASLAAAAASCSATLICAVRPCACLARSCVLPSSCNCGVLAVFCVTASRPIPRSRTHSFARWRSGVVLPVGPGASPAPHSGHARCFAVEQGAFAVAVVVVAAAAAAAAAGMCTRMRTRSVRACVCARVAPDSREPLTSHHSQQRTNHNQRRNNKQRRRRRRR